MQLPTTRSEFAAYCLRKIGDQVSTINVSPDQIDDRISESLNFFYEWHDEATEKTYYSYQVQSADITNGYVTLPTNIISVTSIFPIGLNSLGGNNIFNLRYQILLNDLANISSMQLAPFVQIFQNLQLIEEVLIGQTPFVFTKYSNRIKILTDWSTIAVGQFLVFECYSKIDPAVYPGMWSNRWLISYATALIKQNWGENLGKFTGLNLVGGQQFNSARILTDAQKEVEKLEAQVKSVYSVSQGIFTG